MISTSIAADAEPPSSLATLEEKTPHIQGEQLNYIRAVPNPDLTGAATTRSFGGAKPNISQSLIQVFGALTLIVVLILACAWLAKKLKLAGGASGANIRTLSVLPVGRKEKVMLIESCGKTMLIGVSSAAINTLHVFDAPSSLVDNGSPEEVSIDNQDQVSKQDSQNNFSQHPSARDKSSIKNAPQDFSHFLKAVLAGRGND